MPRSSLTALYLSPHARQRANARSISAEAIDAALRWGRRCWSHGDQIWRLDRRCVQRAAAKGVRVDAHEGVTVVQAPDGSIITVYRNRDPRRIRR